MEQIKVRQCVTRFNDKTVAVYIACIELGAFAGLGAHGKTPAEAVNKLSIMFNELVAA